MPQYRRVKINGSTFFFAVVLANRSSALLVDEIDSLRQVYRTVPNRSAFSTRESRWPLKFWEEKA